MTRHTALRLGLAVLAVLAATTPGRTESPSDLVAKWGETIDFPGFEADLGLTLSKALEFLTKTYGVPFEVDEAALKTAGEPDVLAAPVAEQRLPKMKGVRLETVLRRLLARVPSAEGLTYLMRRDAVEVTTTAAARQEVWGPDYEGPFLPLVHGRFDGQSLPDALKNLADQADFNVVIDARVLEKAQAAKVTARLSNTPLDTAVALLADMADLKPVLTDNLLYVTSRENAVRLEEKRKQQRDTDPNAVPRIGGGRSSPGRRAGMAQ